MKNRETMLRNLPLMTCFLITSGCSFFNLFSTEPFVDTFVDEEGNTIVADTPRNWSQFVSTVEWDVDYEVAGHKMPKGKRTWDDYYLSWFEDLEEVQENAAKYIEFVVRTRRNHGLPDIEGYSTGEPANGPSIESIGESDEP